MDDAKWTPQRVIGHNVKTKREAQQITAKSLGVAAGEVFGKTWPPQTVYMMEAGERKMIAAEVAALAHILSTTVAELFTPPPEVEAVTVGTLAIPADELAAPVGGGADMTALAHDIRALGKARAAIEREVRAQHFILDNAKAALRGEDAPEAPEGDSPTAQAIQAQMSDAYRHYEDGTLRLGEMGDDSGEGQ